MERNFVIVVPGLGDNQKNITIVENLVKHWEESGLTPLVHAVNWHDNQDFAGKLKGLINLIDETASKGNVSLVGISAGGSAVLNAFVERKNVVEKVVNVCGRLRPGGQVLWPRAFKFRTRASNSFAESVALFASQENKLGSGERKRVLTIHALGIDELVPADTTRLDGSQNVSVPRPTHLWAIKYALSSKKPLVDFILKN